ncbi:hypothetical protein AAG906_015603 [Vitis piasezkii]
MLMFFLKMQGKMVQNSIEYGSGPSLILDAQERSTGELKPKHEWDKANNEGSEANAKALFTSKYAWYNPNDLLAFITSMEFVHDSDDDEFTDEQRKPRSQSSSSKSPPRTKQVWLRKDMSKCQVVFNALKAKSSSKWYLDSGCSRHMTGDKSSFTSLERQYSYPYCPKPDEVLYVEGLKENILSISQMCNKDHKVNFYQDLCEIINKKRKVVIIGNRTIDNFYAINLNSRTPLMRCREKLNPTKL